MNETLKRRIEAARDMAVETLCKLNMGMKGANITAAKLQARSEAFTQTLEWARECEEKSNG